MGVKNIKAKGLKKKNRKRDLLLLTLVGAFLASAVFCAVTLIVPREEIAGEFVPPEFDAAARAGVPSDGVSESYSEFSGEGMPYSFSVCGEIFVENGMAQVYLTNPEGNFVWLKLRVYDESGDILGESGLIRPGEFLPSVELRGKAGAGETLAVKIMGYEPETYKSVGAVVLNTRIVGVEADD